MPPADIKRLEDQLDGAGRDAQALVAGLSETQAGWRAGAHSWSVTECLDHLATANRVYLRAMQEPAARAREQGKLRRGPTVPGIGGRCFIRWLEPPVRPHLRWKAPREIRPRAAPALGDAYASFTASQDKVREFLREHADRDLASVRFPNPFVTGVRFSLATGLHVITAHERRHVWRAWRARQAAECALG